VAHRKSLQDKKMREGFSLSSAPGEEGKNQHGGTPDKMKNEGENQ